MLCAETSKREGHTGTISWIEALHTIATRVLFEAFAIPYSRYAARSDRNTLGPVSERILSLETDLSSLITLVTIVFSMLKIARGLEIFWETGPLALSASQDKLHIYWDM